MKETAYLLVLSVLFLSCNTSIQAVKSSNVNIELFPFYESGQWGFNRSDGSKFLSAQYEEAYLPKYGLARIKKDGRYGFINEDGKQVIKCKYNEEGDFKFGKLNALLPVLSKVKSKGKISYINQKGRKVDHEEDEIGSWIKGVKPLIIEHPLSSNIVKKGKYYELKYNYLIESENSTSIEYADTTNLYLDSIFMINNKAIGCKSRGKYGIVLSNQLIGIPLDRSSDKEYIYTIDEYEPKVEFKFDDIQLTKTALNHDPYLFLSAKLNGQWGIINVAGNLIVPYKYKSIKSIEDLGFALVEYAKNRFGYISMKSEYDENRDIKYLITEHFKE